MKLEGETAKSLLACKAVSILILSFLMTGIIDGSAARSRE